MKGWIGGALLLCLLAGTLPAAVNSVTAPEAKAAVQAQSVKKGEISIGAFAKKLEKAAGMTAGTLLKAGEFTNTKQAITLAQAAVLTNRADEARNGTEYDKELYQQAIDKKRLTGLTGLDEEEKKAVRLCFIKGIMPGDSKGEYSQSRAFRPTDKLTTKEAHKILVRVENKSKRVKLSPDGQVIRTTKLPKNYKKYDYILASFPNEFYEKRFSFQRKTYYYEPENLKHYACPKDMKKVVYKDGDKFSDMFEEYGDIWIDRVKTTLETRFNFDYRTVDNAWINKLASTYIYDDDTEWNKKVTDHVKNYVKNAKKNHVVVKADKVVVEPSTLYMEHGSNFYVRCYVKFKVNADTIYTPESERQNELIFSAQATWIEGLKKNQWYELNLDIPFGQIAYNQNPATYPIDSMAEIWEWE